MNDRQAMAACQRALAATERRRGGAAGGDGAGSIDTQAQGNIERGDADAAALREAHHDAALHTRLRGLPLARGVEPLLDELETLRIEVIGARAYRGVARNLLEVRRTRGTSTVGSAARLLDRVASGLFGSTRIESPVVAALDAALFDQERFTRLALALILRWRTGTFEDSAPATLADGAGTDALAGESDEASEDNSREAACHDGVADAGMMAAEPPSADAAVEPAPADKAAWVSAEGSGAADGSSGYRVYTRDYDQIVTARELVAARELRPLRARLDRYLDSQGRVVQRLVGRLQRRLLARQRREWRFDQEHGYLDSARLSRLITDPLHPLSYRQERDAPFRDTCVTLLIDNSRSMIGRPILVAAATADILARTLEQSGVAVEILGYTTVALHGGQPFEHWSANGEVAAPGRLNAVRHIVYKGAQQPWRVARPYLAVMLEHELLKQNIDGEALEWAAARLRRRAAARRILMVISDGAPVDVVTEAANTAHYLADHLATVVRRVEAAGNIELAAIGIGRDVSPLYRRSISVFDARYLGVAMVRQLAGLFSAELDAARCRSMPLVAAWGGGRRNTLTK